MMPAQEIALYCKNHDEELNKLEIKKVTKQELMFEILPLLGRRKVNVSICTNLIDVIEYPANEFRKEWFLYMFYFLDEIEKKRMKAGMELLEILVEAEDDVKKGKVAPACETFNDLRNLLQ